MIDINTAIGPRILVPPSGDMMTGRGYEDVKYQLSIYGHGKYPS